MRKYEQSHPWISFRANLSRMPPRFWMMLGEAVSKIEHIAGVPLRPSEAKKLNQLYLAKGVLATTAIEGNTLSEAEVLRNLEGKLKLPPSKEYLKQEIDNIVAACNDIVKSLEQGQAGLNPLRIKAFNRQVLEKLPPEEGTIPGELRSHSVVVGNVYRGAPAEDCEYLLDRLSQWLAGDDFRAPAGMETAYAVIRAVIAHVYLAWIHPFGNGNGRTARLMELQILLAEGVPMPAAHLLSNHYNQTRTEYYRQLDQASKSGGDLQPFLEYALQGLVDGLKEQLVVIRLQQWDVAWQNYVHDKFRPHAGKTKKRMRDLVLELSLAPDEVPVAEIIQLTPALATAYSGKSLKTLNRDLNGLVKMGLIDRRGKNVKVLKEIILAFLPWRKEKPEAGDPQTGQNDSPSTPHGAVDK